MIFHSQTTTYTQRWNTSNFVLPQPGFHVVGIFVEFCPDLIHKAEGALSPGKVAAPAAQNPPLVSQPNRGERLRRGKGRNTLAINLHKNLAEDLERPKRIEFSKFTAIGEKHAFLISRFPIGTSFSALLLDLFQRAGTALSLKKVSNKIQRHVSHLLFSCSGRFSACLD